ncbi:glycosyltransferase family 2 protein [Pseudomonas fulva]|uniref:glycosyltransferase family 2 protein n=1 Tax=Pseudomonas fulva TaxID=47880 RepID=UPI0039C443D4
MNEHDTEQPQTEVSAIQPHFSGAILGLQGDVLHGWAMDNAQQEHRPVVEVLIDGASVALVRADQYEPSAPVGDQFHGFAVQLRQRWLDKARLITAQIANQSCLLEGALSLPTKPNEDSASIASQVWHNGGLRVGGWCWDPKSPNRHVVVTVREGERVVGQVTCNEHNQALAYRATSDHGFAIHLPWDLADGKLHFLEFFNDMGAQLAGSPIRICCWPEGAEGLIQQLGSAHNGTELMLLTEIVREQSMLLPKSAGWQQYPQWFKVFQHPNQRDLVSTQGKLGLLLISDGNVALEHASLASIDTRRADVHKLSITRSSDLLSAMKQLLIAGCDRILPLKAGDRLAPFAVAQLSALLDDNAAWAYADCDRDGQYGERSLPWLKPVWDFDLFIGADIYTPGSIFSASIVTKALDLLASRATEPMISWEFLIAGIVLATQESQAIVTHLPWVLYHRAYDSPASPEQAEPSALRQKAVDWLCKQLAPGSFVTSVPGYPALLRAHWPLPEQLPRVSLIIPTRDQFKLLEACLEGLLRNTDYPNLEIIVVDNQSSDPNTLAYLTDITTRGVTVLRHPYPFNYSTINNRAVRLAEGEIIGLINNDIEILESSWLKEMVAQALRPDVGAVGAKLLWPNRMVQHGGVVVGVNGLAAHTGNNLTDEDSGYLGTNQITRRQTAVTAACLIVRKSVYEQVNGLDEKFFPVAFNDVDLCLRIQQLGFHMVWSAFAKLVHAESASRGKDQSPEKKSRARREQQNFIERWSAANRSDPYYHPALSIDFLTGPFCGLALPPRNLAPRNNNIF